MINKTDNTLGRGKARFLVTAALTGSALLAAALTLSACGKMGTLETAPPMYGHPEDSASVSSSSVSGGGNAATVSVTADTKLETERALPDANGKNNSPSPYIGAKSTYTAPIEGSGDAERH